jgi:hypothetical protein
MCRKTRVRRINDHRSSQTVEYYLTVPVLHPFGFGLNHYAVLVMSQNRYVLAFSDSLCPISVANDISMCRNGHPSYSSEDLAHKSRRSNVSQLVVGIG